jgi:phosphatidylethanolamine/phosphatidyl-N-methylethanolamine N-methyltransferase
MYLKIKSHLSRFMNLFFQPGRTLFAGGLTNPQRFRPSACASGVLFLKELRRDPKSIGAICSRSPLLGARMAQHIDLNQDGWVVELGGGTGAITGSLLQHRVSASRLIVIEKSEALAAYLRSRFPEVRVIHGDAADMESILHGNQPVKAIVSGLPLRCLSKNAVGRITAACTKILPPGGRLIQFTYASGDFSPWLGVGLKKQESETVWANLPPARIEVFAGPQNEAQSRQVAGAKNW